MRTTHAPAAKTTQNKTKSKSQLTERVRARHPPTFRVARARKPKTVKNNPPLFAGIQTLAAHAHSHTRPRAQRPDARATAQQATARGDRCCAAPCRTRRPSIVKRARRPSSPPRPVQTGLTPPRPAGQKTEDRGQRSEDRGLRTEDRTPHCHPYNAVASATARLASRLTRPLSSNPARDNTPRVYGSPRPADARSTEKKRLH